MLQQPDPKSVWWLTVAMWLSVAVLSVALAFQHEWSLIAVLLAIVVGLVLDERLRRAAGQARPGD